jgi:hypothetical protein
MRLSDYATLNNICYRTAYNRFKRGLIKNAFQDPKTGTIWISENTDKDIIIQLLKEKIETLEKEIIKLKNS